MALSPDTSLGHYDVTTLLGARSSSRLVFAMTWQAALAAVLTLAAPAVVLAQNGDEVVPAKPWAETCDTRLDDDHAPAGRAWMPAERWAWDDRICLDRIADLSTYRTDGADVPGDLTECAAPADEVTRQPLSARFLEMILQHDPYRSASPR